MGNSLVFKKNTTGETHALPDEWSVRILRADGSPATDAEGDLVYQDYERDGRRARLKKTTADFWPAECTPDGFQVIVERADGLPLTLQEVDTMVLLYRMRLREEAVERQEQSAVVVTPKRTNEVLAQLSPAATAAWVQLTTHFTPNLDVQLVHLVGSDGIEELVQASLLHVHGDGKDGLYLVPNAVARCVAAD